MMMINDDDKYHVPIVFSFTRLCVMSEFLGFRLQVLESMFSAKTIIILKTHLRHIIIVSCPGSCF